MSTGGGALPAGVSSDRQTFYAVGHVRWVAVCPSFHTAPLLLGASSTRRRGHFPGGILPKNPMRNREGRAVMVTGVIRGLDVEVVRCLACGEIISYYHRESGATYRPDGVRDDHAEDDMVWVDGDSCVWTVDGGGGAMCSYCDREKTVPCNTIVVHTEDGRCTLLHEHHVLEAVDGNRAVELVRFLGHCGDNDSIPGDFLEEINDVARELAGNPSKGVVRRLPWTFDSEKENGGVPWTRHPESRRMELIIAAANGAGLVIIVADGYDTNTVLWSRTMYRYYCRAAEFDEVAEMGRIALADVVVCDRDLEAFP